MDISRVIVPLGPHEKCNVLFSITLIPCTILLTIQTLVSNTEQSDHGPFISDKVANSAGRKDVS